MIYKSTNITAEIASSIIRREITHIGVNNRKLIDICSLITDGEHQTPERSFLGVPLLTAKNVRDGYIDLAETDFVADEIAAKCWKRCKPRINDILMTCVGTIGRLAVVKENLDAVLVRSVAILRPRTDIIVPDYLAEMLNALQVKNEMQLQIRESAQPGLYLSQVKALEIPVPDLTTQTLIAKFINWCKSPSRQEIPSPPLPQNIAFIQHTIEQVDKIVAKIEEARELRREAVEETINLIATFISQEFSEERSYAWNKKQLGDYIIDDCYGTSEKTMDDPNGIPILRMGNIQNGKIDTTDLKYLYLDEREKDKLLLKKGDIVVNRTNSAELVGKCAVFDLEGDYGFASYLIRLRIKQTEANPWLVAAYINSPLGRKYIFRERTQMTGQANINAKKLRALPIALPSLSEQQQLVGHIHYLEAKIDTLKQYQAETAAELNALLPSILDKAFKGEL